MSTQNDAFVDHLTATLHVTSDQAASSDFDFAQEAPHSIKLRDAAVLVGLQHNQAGQWVLWLTRRSEKMRIHAGQIAFAGGKLEATDQSPRHAALREEKEEIGLQTAMVDILGVLPVHKTITG